MAAKNKIFSVHVIIVSIAMFLPMLAAIRNYLKRESPDDVVYNKPNLSGLVISEEKPLLNATNWFSASYQKEMDDYNNDHWAFKESMVRLNNQFYYDAFNQIRVNRFVSGKNDYVFSESYIFAAFGDDLLEQKKVDDLMTKARVVQDTLKKKGIDLFLVFAPGKGSACREFVEDKYVHPIKNTNHSLFVKASQRLNINHLDLLSYFEKLKAASPYPLFPKFGHHWSYYGECIAVDTILGYIENLHHCDLPSMVWDTIAVLDTVPSFSRDNDVLKGMNLYENPDQDMKLAYPDIKFENDPAKNTTRVLTISDSYWYGPVYMQVPQRCMAGGEFWYYYNRVVPLRDGENIEVWQLDLKKEIESYPVIMIMYSEGNLPGFGNTFIQDAYEMYTSPKTYYARNEKNKLIQSYAKQVRESPVLLKKSTLRSEDLQIPLDSAIKFDAMKLAGLIK